MQNIFKRFLSIALILSLLLSVPCLTFAAEESNSVAVNTTTQQVYTDVSTALLSASAGDTIELSCNTSATVLTLLRDITLDLNGYKLDAGYVSCFGHIVDNSAAREGLLNVAKENFLIQKSNPQLPMRTSEGYRFLDVAKFNAAYRADSAKFAFQPFIDAAGHSTMVADLAATGVSVQVRASWKQSGGMRSQTFFYSADLVANFLNSYTNAGETEKYNQMFSLKLTNAEAFEELTFEAVVSSETGVEFTSDPIVAGDQNDGEGGNEGSGNEGSSDRLWEGKKITILGDSISTGGYPGILENMTGATLQNLSVSGTLLAGGLSDKVANVASDADLVIVFGGTNDYWHKKVQIGTADSSDASTYVGALRYIFNYLKTNRPNAKCLFVFPADQTFSGNPSSTDFGKGTLADFRAAFLAFCTENNVHYVNLADTAFDSAKHTGDGVHPNSAGHQIIAQAIFDKISTGLKTSITVTRQKQLLSGVNSQLPDSALASAPGVVFKTAPYAYTDKSLFAGKHITRIGIPVKSVQALDENQTFTLSVVKTTSDSYQYVSQNVLKLPLDQLGSFTTVNKWIYVDVDLHLAADETLAFGMPNDTVTWGYSTSNTSRYNFRSATGSWNSIIREAIFFDIYATETLTFEETEHGLAMVTQGQIFPNVLADFPESAIAGGNPVEFKTPPYSYVNQTLFAGKHISRIGIPVQTVNALDNNQKFKISVVKTGSGAYQYVSEHEFALPLDQLGDSTTVNKWIYIDVDLQLAEDETLAFGSNDQSVIWAWKRGFADNTYQFRDAAGSKTTGIFFDIYAETVLTYEDYQKQLKEEQDRLEAEQEQARLDAQLQKALAGKGISILGDSISTYQGWSNNTSYNSTIGSNAVYYTGSRDGFSAVNETWWMQTVTRTGLELVVNNSWSGDEVTNRGVSRAQQLHNNEGTEPDIIAVYLGINDFRRGRTLEAFRAKYEEMIAGMQNKYPDKDIYLFTLLYTSNMESSYYKPEEVVRYNAVIKEIAEAYGCTLVDIYTDTGITPQNLATYMGDGTLHPNYAGMDLITKCFVDALVNKYL